MTDTNMEKLGAFSDEQEAQKLADVCAAGRPASGTPRTDAAIVQMGSLKVCTSSFSRQLETELSAAREKVETLKAALGGLYGLMQLLAVRDGKALMVGWEQNHRAIEARAALATSDEPAKVLK